MECFSCQAIAGERIISPGRTIFNGEYWHIEHAYPCGMLGWLVIVLNRHCEALHDLSEAEFAELGAIQYRASLALQRKLNPEKEYSVCFHEASNFNHIHFHHIAKPHDLPAHLKGVGIFAMLKVSPEEAVPPAEIVHFCEELSRDF